MIAHKNSNITFNKGAEGSTVNFSSDADSIKIVNNSADEITISGAKSGTVSAGDSKTIKEAVDNSGINGNSGDVGNSSEVTKPVISGDYTYSGKCILLGTYEQDNDLSNGAEPIEWEVLGKDENGILVISRYVLDFKKYNEQSEEVTWETCSLRSWLNDTFYSSAFSEADQSKINTVTLENPDNRWKRTKGGNNTTDKVFCLSVDEIVNHYEFNEFEESEYVGDSQQLITPATEYAEKQGVCVWTITEEDYEDIFAHWGYTQDCINSKGGFWWLRTPGNNSGNACFVAGNGNAGFYYNRSIDDDEIGVRPAMYLKQ